MDTPHTKSTQVTMLTYQQNSKDYVYMHSMHTPPFGRKEYMTDNDVKLQMDITGQN